MCGFVCFVNENNLSKKYLNLANSGKLSNHRGPDSQNYYSVKNFTAYFRRLSIIDISKKSDQPFVSENKRYILVFNGEIYNFLELRNDLENKNVKFKTRGDAEVLLNCFIHYGENFVEHLRGMFSFCIWDKYASKLIAYRDRFGQKPFYYFKTKNGLVISSEIKDIKKVISLSKNFEITNRYLLRNILDVGNKTFYKNLFRLEPSKKLIFQKNKIKITKYYDLKISEDRNFDNEEFINIFNECIKIHLRSDVKMAFLLSGGIDSSSIVGSSLNFTKNVKAFTVIPKLTFNEKPYINDFIKKKKFSHEYIDLDNKLNFESFVKTLTNHDEPFHGTNTIYQFLLNKEIKKRNYKVLLTGEGADEVLGGYDRMIIYYLCHLLENGEKKKYKEVILKNRLNKNLIGRKILKLKNKIKNFHTDFENDKSFEYLYSQVDKEKFYNLRWNNIKKIDKNIFKNSLKNSIFSNDLQLALRMSDRNSMSASLENRTPFLDHKFVDYIFSIKTEDFYYNNLSKGMLRVSMKNNCTKKILNRKVKTGRPGSDFYFLFKKVYSDYIDLLESSNLCDYGFNIKKIKKSLIGYKKNSGTNIHLNKDFKNDINFFFRIFSYLVWSEIN